MLFEVDGDQLNISLEMELDDVVKFHEFIKDKLEYIEAINVEESEFMIFKTSALFQLLISIKNSKPTLSIPIIDSDFIEFSEYGKVKWILK